MSSKRKRRRKGEADAASQPSAPKPPPGVATAIGPLLERAGLSKLGKQPAEPRGRETKGGHKPPPAGARAAQPAPRPAAPAVQPGAPEPAPEPLSSRELALLHQAYKGATPIYRPKRGRVQQAPRREHAARETADAAAEAAARARLSDLVGGGVRFEVSWDGELVQGLRRGAERKLLSRLSGSSFTPEAELDLHGMRRAEVERAVSQFVRAEHRRGRRYLLLISGKGQHSEDGVGVLGEALVHALSRGAAAPLVQAFTSAHPRHGGAGAIAVMLG